MTAQRAPVSSTASTALRSRSPPPTWTGSGFTANTISVISAVCFGAPANAPSRSTTCRRSARNSDEGRQRAVVPDAVPSHVRNLATGWEAAHDTWNHVEPASLAELLARRKEELVPEADAEERPRAVERAAQGLDETARCE